MWGWVGEIFKSLVGPIFEAFRQWQERRTARQLGRVEQSNKGLTETVERTRNANEARSGVAGMSDDQLDDELRGKPSDRRR